MSNTVIKVENLSKKYVLSHQSQERYTALRDIVTNGVKRWGKRLLTPFSGHNLLPADSQEDFYALRDVTFDVKLGDRVGIIGRNGAGKSTLLKVLSRITEPTSGKVSIKGRVASLLEVGTGFHPELTGRENIYLNGAILGMSRFDIKRKFDEIVSFAEVERFLDTPVKRYSSGMYVRLAFAVAAHLETEILVVDEVLAVGDAQFQKKCLGKMQDVGKDGRTVLFVSHNMAAIKTLCTTAVGLYEGRVINYGAVGAVVEEYLSRGLHNRTVYTPSQYGTSSVNKVFQLHSLRVVAEEGGSEHFTVKTPLRFEFSYSLFLDEALFYIGFHLRTIAGECAFVTSSIPIRITRNAYLSTCHIPGDLLNVGTYTIHLYCVKDGSNVLCDEDNPLTFEIHDVERPEGAWMGDYPGAVRPNLAWDISVIQEHL